jgi:hypothetical protein
LRAERGLRHVLVEHGEVLSAIVRVGDVVEDDAGGGVRGRRGDELGEFLVDLGAECEAVERVGGREAPGVGSGGGVVEEEGTVGVEKLVADGRLRPERGGGEVEGGGICGQKHGEKLLRRRRKREETNKERQSSTSSPPCGASARSRWRREQCCP